MVETAGSCTGSRVSRQGARKHLPSACGRDPWPHRFHAESDGRGWFRIRDISPGTYTVEVWHERLGKQRVSVDIVAGRSTSLDVDLHSSDLTAT